MSCTGCHVFFLCQNNGKRWHKNFDRTLGGCHFVLWVKRGGLNSPTANGPLRTPLQVTFPSCIPTYPPTYLPCPTHLPISCYWLDQILIITPALIYQDPNLNHEALKGIWRAGEKPGGDSHFIFIRRLGFQYLPFTPQKIRNFKHPKKYLKF